MNRLVGTVALIYLPVLAVIAGVGFQLGLGDVPAVGSRIQSIISYRDDLPLPAAKPLDAEIARSALEDAAAPRLATGQVVVVPPRPAPASTPVAPPVSSPTAAKERAPQPNQEGQTGSSAGRADGTAARGGRRPMSPERHASGEKNNSGNDR